MCECFIGFPVIEIVININPFPNNVFICYRIAKILILRK